MVNQGLPGQVVVTMVIVLVVAGVVGVTTGTEVGEVGGGEMGGGVGVTVLLLGQGEVECSMVVDSELQDSEPQGSTPWLAAASLTCITPAKAGLAARARRATE